MAIRNDAGLMLKWFFFFIFEEEFSVDGERHGEAGRLFHRG